MSKHRLHKRIYTIIKAALPVAKGYSLHADYSCSGSRRSGITRIPLFLGPGKSRISQLCYVDLIILQHRAIKVLVEIEESGRQPTKILGKFLTSAIATHFAHPSLSPAPIPKDKKVLFVQIISSDDLRPNTSRRRQWQSIGEFIRAMVRKGNVKGIFDYRLLVGKPSEFRTNSLLTHGLTSTISDFLRL